MNCCFDNSASASKNTHICWSIRGKQILVESKKKEYFPCFPSFVHSFIHSTNTCWVPAMKWTGVSKNLVLLGKPPRINIIVDHWEINMMIMCCENWLGVLCPLPSPYHPYSTIQGSFCNFILVFSLFCFQYSLRNTVFYYPYFLSFHTFLSIFGH